MKVATAATIALILVGFVRPVSSQSIVKEDNGRLTIALRGTPLSQALEQFAKVSGESLVYESTLVAGRTSYCVVEGAQIEQGLRCILSNTSLDYFRLSSGTIVLADAAAQSPLYGYITGLVRDQNTGHPLAEANVRLVGLSVGAATNAGGTFVLPPLLPGTYEIRISHVSYYSWTGELQVGVGSNTPTSIELQPRSIPIAPIVVDGATRRLLSQQLGSPELEADVDRTPATVDVFRNVTTLAGVRTNDATADIFVDGADAGQMQISVDGAPLYLPRQSIGPIGPFSAFAFDRLTIHRAAYGVSPGSMIGGIVDAEHGVDSPWSHVQVDPSGVNARLKLGGTDNGGRLAVMAAGRAGSWDVYSPARYADVLSRWSAADPFLIIAPLRLYEYATDAFVTDTLGLRTVVDPSVKYSDAHAAFEYRPSLLRTLSGSIYVGRQALAGGRDAPADPLVDVPIPNGQPSFSAADDYDWFSAAGQIKYTTFAGRRTLVTTQLFGSSYRLQHGYDLVDNLSLPLFFDGLGPAERLQTIGLPINDRNTMESVGLRSKLEHARGAHQFSVGFESVVKNSTTNLQSYTTQDLRAEQSAFTTSLELATSGGQYNANTTTFTGILEDRFALSDALHVLGGIRTTYVDTRRTVYAEPRASLNLDKNTRAGIPVSARLAAGVYRQYETQIDLSALNAGSLLPTVRLWLPVDRSVRPPLAYHVAASGSVAPVPGWVLAINGFGRFFSDALTFDYSVDGPSEDGLQSGFLTTVDGRTVGVDGEISRISRHVSATVRYAFVNTRNKSNTLFGGRPVSQPDTEPHRFSAEVTAKPLRSVLIRLRWHSGWDRRWAYTRAYYDYFGHSEDLRLHNGIDFGNPNAHALPAMHRLDLGVAVSQPVGRLSVQLRADVINVFNRDNVASYRITYDGENLVSVARPMIPRIATVSARLSWRFGSYFDR